MVSVAKIQPEKTAPKAKAKKTPLRLVQRSANDYVGLVQRVAYGMARRLPARVDVRDLIGAGTLGLLDAMRKYDPAQNDNFEAYAEIRIRGAILDELRSLDWVPRSVRQKAQELEQTTHTLVGTLGRAPADEEVAGSLAIPMDRYDRMVASARSVAVLSLDDLAGPGGEPGGFQVRDDRGESALDQLCRRSSTAALSAAIEALPERERLVLSLYYLEGLKLKEVGAILGVTESRACQIHGLALGRLRSRMQEAA